ncbi:hypothetical protein [Wansuia hejianensis]|uniref:Uncharacterized protein n=1 Tax=Wansuia hejianensis TaxID=2763667 RepID=A0A926F3T7_9FIRM|nr:hypothetical protein [Wansuia hejianensis]MBC8591379.1 hypothetical protein [Wansuia hejianensis]
MNIIESIIKKDIIYEEEIIKENARMDARDEREKLTKQKNTRNQNIILLRNLIIGIIFIIGMYFIIYKPLYDMIR